MRRATLALRIALIAGLTLTAASSSAQGNSNNTPQRFGSINCRDKIPCASGTAYFSASDYAANANSCLQQGLGMSLPDGFFDTTAGLDSNNCLTVRPELLMKKDAKTILPKCCEITLSENNCTFHCDLVNGW